MKLVTGRVFKVHAARMTDKMHESMQIGINIDDVKSENKMLIVNYTVRNRYEPEVAEMIVSGELQFEVEDKKLKEIMAEWTSKKTLDLALSEQILNTANYAMSAVGTLLAFAIGVPAPINPPQARISKPETQNKQAAS